jgi:glycosyltransferase involved in cell wall biosynthesis
MVPVGPERKVKEFPIRCLTPFDGEDGSYVLYGSGGCSLYDTEKLLRIGAFDEIYAPAYVEDLDAGYRGWQRGWPTVFVAEARVVHYHRSTTSRYYKPDLLQSFVEFNYLRFLARRIAAPRLFLKLWREAALRLNFLAVEQPAYTEWALESLQFASRAVRRVLPRPKDLWREDWIFALGSGEVAVFPGRARGDRKVVLIASPYLPYPLSHGGAVRMFNLMRRAAADYDVVLVAFVEKLAAPPRELLAIAREVVLVRLLGSHLLPNTERPDVVEEFHSPAFEAALRLTVRKHSPAVAQLEFTQMAQYAQDCAPAKTLLVEHDITFDLQQQLLALNNDWETRRQYERWLRFEKAAWRDVECVVTMSEKDRRVVEGARAVALPNGVDLERFRPGGREPEPRRILFLGAFQHLPNVMAAHFFLTEAWPHLKDVTLHLIAGNRPQYFLDRYRDVVRLDLAQPGIEVEEFVADVRPAYERAAVVIAPLVASAGTNIKIMEAMAMGKAIVSTPAGINGLALEPGRDVIVVRTGEEVAAAITSLLEDSGKRKMLECNARAKVEREFDWDVIARNQRDLYESLTSIGVGHA